MDETKMAGIVYWNGWYKVQDTREPDTYEDMEWVEETMGLPNVNGRWFYDYSSAMYYFRNKNDAVMYQIGWQNASAT